MLASPHLTAFGEQSGQVFLIYFFPPLPMEASIRYICSLKECKHILSFNLFVNICFGKPIRLLESAFLSEIKLQLDAWADMLERQGRDCLFLEVCDRIDIKPKKDMFLL